jgi:hypothetical protein
MSYQPSIGGLFGIPPPVQSPLSVFGRALLEANRKPRNRSEWEARFEFWQKPASESEEAQIASAAKRISRALGHSRDLSLRSWTIIEQGSYHNNTNTRAESDMDLCVCLTDAFFTEGPPGDAPTLAELGRVLLPFTFEQYRAHIAWCLQQEFGMVAVTLGSKAIHLHKNDAERIHADVVPAYRFERYGPRLAPLGRRGAAELGVALLTRNGQRVTNFPEQHYRNGCAKNNLTARRYKRVVRILKRLRNHMADNPELPSGLRAQVRAIASFLIESLVYNCPNELFRHTVIYDDVVAVLSHVSAALQGQQRTLLLGPFAYDCWTEVNGVKPLFSAEQTWAVQSAAQFVAAARAYVGT